MRRVLAIVLLLLAPTGAAAADTTPPTLGELTPADGATHYGYHAFYGAPVIRWSATDTESGLAGYRLFLDGVQYDAGPHVTQHDQIGPGWHSDPPGTISPGPHEWRLEAYDNAGNIRDSGPRTFTFVVDDAKPEYFSDEGRSPANGAMMKTVPTLKWKPTTDAGSGVAYQELFIDGRHVATLPPDATSYQPEDWPYSGSHDWYVQAIDAAGNSRWNERWYFDVDKHPPSVHLRVESGARALTGQAVHFVASSYDNVITRFEWDFDGDGTFEDGAREASHVFTTPGTKTVAARVTDGVGWTTTDTETVEIVLAPPAGPTGVSINDGARFTNDPNVVITTRWVPFAASALLSNDGGFGAAVSHPLAAQIPWVLDSSGSERLPKTVYVRFPGASSNDATYQDDIILDETAPLISRATASRVRRAYSVKLRAHDSTSGIASVQVTRDRRRPGTERRWSRTLRVSGRAPRWVRATDHAGNRSSWRRIALRR